jgi:hypothetical protein
MRCDVVANSLFRFSCCPPCTETPSSSRNWHVSSSTKANRHRPHSSQPVGVRHLRQQALNPSNACSAPARCCPSPCGTGSKRPSARKAVGNCVCFGRGGEEGGHILSARANTATTGNPALLCFCTVGSVVKNNRLLVVEGVGVCVCAEVPVN